MIAIVDCGSTKGDWRFLPAEGHLLPYSTPGFNPFIQSADEIHDILHSSFQDQKNIAPLRQLYFYGAGCADAKRSEIVAAALRRQFPEATIRVAGDLLGAARACCGKAAGIACVLGTGSSSCLYDGEQIVDQIASLGHLLGDEGSGYHLGKKLIQAYVYRDLPATLRLAFEQRYPGGERALIDLVYKEDTKATVASFAKFVYENQQHPYMQSLANSAFSTFLERQLIKYPDHQKLPVSFCGSIAYHFRDLLKRQLAKHHLLAGSIIKKPIDGLVAFHAGDQAGQ